MPPTVPILVDDKYPDGPPNDFESFIADYLERARRGEMKAIAFAIVNPDDSIASAWHCTGKSSILLSAAIAKLARDYGRAMDEWPR